MTNAEEKERFLIQIYRDGTTTFAAGVTVGQVLAALDAIRTYLFGLTLNPTPTAGEQAAELPE